jgi:hypothetical protein
MTSLLSLRMQIVKRIHSTQSGVVGLTASFGPGHRNQEVYKQLRPPRVGLHKAVKYHLTSNHCYADRMWSGISRMTLQLSKRARK